MRALLSTHEVDKSSFGVEPHGYIRAQGRHGRVARANCTIKDYVVLITVYS